MLPFCVNKDLLLCVYICAYNNERIILIIILCLFVFFVMYLSAVNYNVITVMFRAGAHITGGGVWGVPMHYRYYTSTQNLT